MSAAHDVLRKQLGKVGVWTFAFDSLSAADIATVAGAVEELGYPSLWVPEGGGSRDVVGLLSFLLASTDQLTVASGIANLTARPPDVLQSGATLIADTYGSRLVLGVGVGHEYTSQRRGIDWNRPLARTRSYLKAMDASAPHFPQPAAPVQRMLAALGDRMLGLSSEMSLGAHTYFVPPEHTERARRVLGPEPVLAVEQSVVLDSDPVSARATAREWAVHYLALPNYANNWRRLGFTEADVEGAGSDRLIDAAVAWGSIDHVVTRVRSHLDAGADHVCVQVIGDEDQTSLTRALTELAPPLLAV